MSEIPTPFKILSAITAGTLVGCSVAEAISPIPTEQAKNITGTFELAGAEIGDNFWSTQVIYGKLNPLDKEGLTKQDLTCLNIEINKANFDFCTFESRDGAKENWWIKSPEGWLELQKIVKSGYNMENEIINLATWTLDQENVIWYPQNQDDWLKDSQNPNFGITFLPPSVFGENPIQGYDRSSGLGIKIPLIQVENDPFSQENIFQAIAYRTGFQIGGVTPTLVQPTETPTPVESTLPPEMTEKYLGQFDKWENGTKEVNGVETDVIYGFQGETKKVIAMNIEVNGEMRMTGVSETTVYDKENNSHDIYVYIDPNWSASDDDDPRGPDEKRGRVTVTEATATMLFGKPENPDTPVFWNALAQQMGLSVDKTIDLVMRENNGITNFKVPVGERQKITFNSDMTKLPYPANLNKPIAIKVIFSKDDYNRLPEEIKEKRSVITYEREGEEYGQFEGRLLWTDSDGQINIYCIITTIEVYFGLDPNGYGKDGPSLSTETQKAVSKISYSLFDLIGDGKENKVKYYGDSVPKAFDANLTTFR